MQTLHDTPFMRELGEYAAAMIREAGDTSSPRLGKFKRPLTPQENYVSDCLLAAGELVVACDQMEYALAYLSGYRTRLTSSGEMITRIDYLAYQLENLYLRIGMILDRSLKLTNVVFQLGIQPRDCKDQVVMNNDHVRRTSVRDRLRAINKAVQPYTQVRNVITHHKRYNDPDLQKIEAYFILEKSNHIYQDPIVENLRQFYKTNADRYVHDRRNELIPAIINFVDLVSRLFDALLPVFRARHQALADSIEKRRRNGG